MPSLSLSFNAPTLVLISRMSCFIWFKKLISRREFKRLRHLFIEDMSVARCRLNVGVIERSLVWPWGGVWMLLFQNVLPYSATLHREQLSALALGQCRDGVGLETVQTSARRQRKMLGFPLIEKPERAHEAL